MERVGLRENNSQPDQDVIMREITQEGKYAKQLYSLYLNYSKKPLEKPQLDTFVREYIEIIKDCSDKTTLSRSALTASLLAQ
jgi:hypothetical protein